MAVRLSFWPDLLFTGFRAERAYVCPMQSRSDIGQQLHRLRGNAGISQGDLAKRMNVSQARISQIENAGPGHVDVLLAYARALGVVLSLVGTPIKQAGKDGRSFLFGPR